MISLRRLVIIIAAGAAMSIIISACAGTNAPSASETPPIKDRITALAAQAKKDGNQDLYRIFRDGRVTTAERDHAFQLFSTCMQRSGVIVGPPQVSVADGLTLVYTVDNNGLSVDAANKTLVDCNQRYWADPVAYYVGSHTQVMDKAVRSEAIACIRNKGFKLTGQETDFKQMVGNPPSDGQTKVAVDCVTAAVQALYPTMPSVPLTY